MILVTGGLGYIGSHTVVQLLNNGYDVVIIDNLSNSKFDVYEKICKLTKKKPHVYILDIRDDISHIFYNHAIDVVMHFAGLKSVNKSIEDPLMYYDVNINTTMNLLKTMQQNNVKKIIFSSSATVYGSQQSPLNESLPIGIGISNPYGRTKYMIELILKDLANDPSWSITCLRYFNPVGAHESGLIGEDPNDVPNNLMPYILKVSVGIYDKLTVHGDDYDTPDGTCIRDFIHVEDLAGGHIAAIRKLLPGYHVYNLGTGNGYSVREIIDCFQRVNKVKLNCVTGPRRKGDLPIVFATSENKLDWYPEKNLDDMCTSAYRFMINNVSN